MKINDACISFDGRLRALVAAAFLGAIAATLSTPAVAHSQRPSSAESKGATTTFRFSNIPVRSALQLLAEEGQFNLVVSDSVKGNISLHLEDVTWEQALDVVLKLKGLEQRVEGRSRAVTAKGR